MRSPGHQTTSGQTSLPGQSPASHRQPTTDHRTVATRQPDLTIAECASYRAAVDSLTEELPAHTGPRSLATAEQVLLDRLDDREIVSVLARTPRGHGGAIGGLLNEIRSFVAVPRRRPSSLTNLVRIFLSAQIDAVWWGGTRPYQTDADLIESGDLIDLDRLRRDGALRFDYRKQPMNWPGRLIRAAQRRLRPRHRPDGAGLRFCYARPETVVLLNQIATDLARAAPAGTPRPWVTSLARSVAHQHRLRSLGYPAMLPSAHCVGYAIDIEMDWLRRFGADGALAALLLDRQERGDANVIDEGQVWHICINPAVASRLRLEFDDGPNPLSGA